MKTSIFYISSLIIITLFLLLIRYFNNNKHNLRFLKNKHFGLSRLNKTDINRKITTSFKTNNNIFICKLLNLNKDFIIILSNKIEQKINNTKTTYRAKNGVVFIDDISKQLLTISLKNHKPTIFYNYRNLYTKLNLKQKENKIFKIVLANNILHKVVDMHDYLNNILKIFNKSKNAKCIHYYNDNMCFYAQILSFCKFNNNIKSIYRYSEYDIFYMIKRFYKHLYNLEFELNFLISYLLVLFK